MDSVPMSMAMGLSLLANQERTMGKPRGREQRGAHRELPSPEYRLGKLGGLEPLPPFHKVDGELGGGIRLINRSERGLEEKLGGWA